MNIDPIISQAAQKYGVDPHLIRAVIQTESSGNPQALNPDTQAAGLMQLIPSTAQSLGVQDPMDPTQNVMGGTALLRQNIDRYGNVDDAVRAYHGGTNQANWGPKTQDYYQKVNANFQSLKATDQNTQPVQKMADSQTQSGISTDRLLQMLQAPGDTPQQAQQAPSSAGSGIPTDRLLQMLQAPGEPQPEQQPQQQQAPAMPGPADQVKQTLPSDQPGMGRFRHVESVGNDLPSYYRFAKGAKDILDGGAQLLAHSLPDSAVNSVNTATQYVNDLPVIGPVTKAIGMVPATSQQLDQDIAKSNQQYEADRTRAGGSGFDGYRMMGRTAASWPLARVLPTGSTFGGAALAGGASGAATAALIPTTDANEDYWAAKNDQIRDGAAAGAVLGPAGYGLSKLISPTVSPEVQYLMDRGVTPTPGQIVGGHAAWLEDKASSIPGVGDVIKNAQRRTIQDFNRAAYNDVLEPLGTKYQGHVGREGVEAVEGQLHDAYNNLLPKLTFRADGQLTDEINNISSMAQMMPPQQAQQFANILQNRIAPRLSDTGAMDGQTFKGLESELNKTIKGYRSDPSFDNRQLGSSLQEVLTSFRNNLARSNPEYPQLAQLNQAWARFTRVRDAASGIGASEGVFTPAQLQAAVRKGDSSVGKGAFATGNALMQDLSEAGKSVLGSKYPDSGTAGRMMTAALLTGHFSPPAAAGSAIGALPYTTMGQKLAAAILAKRPDGASEFAAGLRHLAPALRQAIIYSAFGL